MRCAMLTAMAERVVHAGHRSMRGVWCCSLASPRCSRLNFFNFRLHLALSPFGVNFNSFWVAQPGNAHEQRANLADIRAERSVSSDALPHNAHLTHTIPVLPVTINIILSNCIAAHREQRAVNPASRSIYRLSVRHQSHPNRIHWAARAPCWIDRTLQPPSSLLSGPSRRSRPH